MNTYFLYARKSTDVEDKQVLSIDAQLNELRDFAGREDLNVVNELVEKRSAKTPGRPVFNAMLERIEAGEADGIIAWHPDRLARNSIDGGRIIYLLDTGKIKTLKFPTFRFESDPQGKFMLNIMFGQSKYYVDSLSENTKRGLREKVRRGEYPGHAPFGYVNDHRTRKIVVVPKEAEIVRQAFELYATGQTKLDSLREFFADHGIRTNKGKLVGRSFVSHVLSNPLYYGHFIYAGEIHEGNHQPIISKKLFDEVQAVLNRRWRYSPGEQSTKPKELLGLFHCADCGGAITAEIQKGHTYYRCTKKNRAQRCFQPYIREEALNDEITALLKPFSVPVEWAEYMLSRIKEEKKQDTQSAMKLATQMRAEIEKINLRLKKLLDSFVDELIDRQMFMEKKAELMSLKKTLEEDKNACTAGKATWLEPFQKWILTARNAAEIAVSSSLQQKRVLALEVFGSNLVLDRKKARGSCVEPWPLIPENTSTGGMVGWPGLEPGTNGLKGRCSTD